MDVLQPVVKAATTAFGAIATKEAATVILLSGILHIVVGLLTSVSG
jgi:hypothetical protein